MNRKTLSRIVLFAALAAAIVAAYAYRDWLNVAALESWVKSAGALGPVLYMAVYAIATVLFLPGSVLTLAGGALFGHTRFNPPKGILLTGASGTGKTLLARALAGELGLTLITVDQPSLLSKWVGESEKGLREVFKRAKQASPCILFFDEIESLVPARSAQEAGSLFPRLVSQLFRELDELHGSLGVVVLGATNRPDLMEPALLRAGRFDYVLELPLPDRDERRKILEIHTEGLPLENDANLDELAEATGGWTGADLDLVCKKAAILALEEFRGRTSERFRVALRHLREAQAQVKTMK